MMNRSYKEKRKSSGRMVRNIAPKTGPQNVYEPPKTQKIR